MTVRDRLRAGLERSFPDFAPLVENATYEPQDPSLISDVDDAIAAHGRGNPWPLALAQYHARITEPLGVLIAANTPMSDEVAGVVGEIITGRYKRNSSGKGRFRAWAVLEAVDYVQRARKAHHDHQPAAEWAAGLTSNKAVFEFVATRLNKLNMTADAVEQIVKRNKRRLKSGTNTPL